MSEENAEVEERLSRLDEILSDEDWLREYEDFLAWLEAPASIDGKAPNRRF